MPGNIWEPLLQNGKIVYQSEEEKPTESGKTQIDLETAKKLIEQYKTENLILKQAENTNASNVKKKKLQLCWKQK